MKEVLPKNIATSLKDVRFLDFFFRQMRRVDGKERGFLESIGAARNYPFVSPCGVELNYVRPADAAVVFHTVQERSAAGGGVDERDFPAKELLFAGALTQPFFPDKLLISKRSGRLYHSLAEGCGSHDDNSKVLGNSVHDWGERHLPKPITPLHSADNREEYGLLKSSVAVTLSSDIVMGDSNHHKDLGPSSLGNKEYSGMDFIAFDSGYRYPIAFLPDEAEPGSWGLPLVEGGEPMKMLD